MSWEKILKDSRFEYFEDGSPIDAGLVRSNSAFRAFVKEIEKHIKEIKDLGSKISALDLGGAGQRYAKTIDKRLESLEDFVINTDIKNPVDDEEYQPHIIQREDW